ncbi:CD1375 family protein [Lysinibacillus xylanilyticus]
MYQFTKDHQFVKDYVLLIKEGKRTIDEVPELFNLRECVAASL